MNPVQKIMINGSPKAKRQEQLADCCLSFPASLWRYNGVEIIEDDTKVAYKGIGSIGKCFCSNMESLCNSSCNRGAVACLFSLIGCVSLLAGYTATSLCGATCLCCGSCCKVCALLDEKAAKYHDLATDYLIKRGQLPEKVEDEVNLESLSSKTQKDIDQILSQFDVKNEQKKQIKKIDQDFLQAYKNLYLREEI